LVPVGTIILGLQNEVEALNVAVPPPVAVPVELRELLVPFELADDPVPVERHKHPPADVLPPRRLFGGQLEALRKLGTANVGKDVQHVLRAAEHPDSHHVRVGVVVQAGVGEPG
jgi:hypothetical protein